MTYAANNVVLGRHLDTAEKRIKREIDKIAAGGASVAVFTGATAVDGTSGLVPAPLVGDNMKFLRGDGTWATVESGSPGGGYIIGSKVSSVEGGFWQDTINDTPVLKLRHGDYEYNFAYDNLTFAGGASSVLETVTPNTYVLGTASVSNDGGVWYEVNNDVPTLNLHNGNFNYSFNYDSITYKGGNSHLAAYLPFDASTTADACGNEWTAVESPSLDSGVKKFGSNAVHLPANSGLYADDFLDFSQETWAFDTWICVRSHGCLFSFGVFPNSTTRDYVGYTFNSGGFAICGTTNYWQADATDIKSTTLFPNLNQWYHFAFVKRGSDVFIFVDGTLIRQFTLTEAVNLGQRVYLGGDRQTYDSDIYLDNVRFHTEALWTSNFTPPTAEDYL